MVIVSDSNGRTDGTAYEILKLIPANIPIVIVARCEGFIFNDALLLLDKYVLIEFLEYGWDWKYNIHQWGVNTQDFDFMQGIEWQKLDDFIVNKPPVITFKRELLKSEKTEKLLPIEYPCLNPIPETVTKEQFESRFLQVAFTWGLSHEGRKALHANIWFNAGKYGYNVCDNLYYLNAFLEHEKNPKKWFTANVPHYSRLPIKQIINVTGNAKISLSPAGAGRKCFRHMEASMNSTMLMWEDEIAWTYEWEHNANCLISKEGEEIETIQQALNNPDLYEIYLAGVENCRKYELNTYINNYILPAIEKA